MYTDGIWIQVPHLAKKLLSVPICIELDRTSRNNTYWAWSEPPKGSSPAFVMSDGGQDLDSIANVAKRGVARGIACLIEAGLQSGPQDVEWQCRTPSLYSTATSDISAITKACCQRENRWLTLRLRDAFKVSP